jgi:hypothetical protein
MLQVTASSATVEEREVERPCGMLELDVDLIRIQDPFNTIK